MEYITNGDFSATPFDDGWVNPCSDNAFTEDAGRIYATSSIELKHFQMSQTFVLPVTVTEVLSATLAADIEWKNCNSGSNRAVFTVYITRPSTTIRDIWSVTKRLIADGADSISEDVLTHITEGANFEAAGTYTFRVHSALSQYTNGDPEAWWDNISLVLTVKHEITISEVASPIELFGTLPHIPPSSDQEVLLAGLNDTKVYVYQTGTPEGIYDTDDIDFGMMGQEKTLDRVILVSHADAPHTVQVYYSLDSGATWVSIGSVTLQKGVASVIHTWKTAEKFRLRFRGDGLHLVSWEAQAKIEGPQKGDD